MKTVLIVEDEKMIRQGLKTMISRSGVPVEIIMECSNGEMALEILKEQKVDVMFTDIRMPKMDGIELVKHVQELAHRPLTVAISGYDDFSYAVEMMRCGVREYILKPIERQKIQEILKKLDDEIANNKENDTTNRKIGYQQLKYLMLTEQVSEEEMEVLEKQYEKEFFQGAYFICCVGNREENKMQGPYIYLHSIDMNDIYLVAEENVELLLKNELFQKHVGISQSHSGMREVRQAYEEAAQARHIAFCVGEARVCFDRKKKQIPEKLAEEAEKLLTEEARLQRVQLLGTDKTEEIKKTFRTLFDAAAMERIESEAFAACMEKFFVDLKKTYRNALQDEENNILEFQKLWDFDTLEAFRTEFMDWLLMLHDKIGGQLDMNRNRQKIQLALEYMKENYAKDLNMAVVSNYISMNYSLFSYSFKQYTGSNFVNYLKNIRMEEAKRLLRETDLRIIEISQAVGYDNEKHFMKIFKGACGVSPSEYRKNMSR